MSFSSMAAELVGSLPKLPYTYALTLINRAWKEIRESGLWSFNLYEQSWITPPIINAGTVAVTQGLNTLTFDATAIAAINAAQAAQPYSLITTRQFRIAVGGIYNLVTYNPGTGAATLDRIWGDTGGQLAYTIYQVYYVPQFADHLRWMSVRNPIMFLWLNLTMTREELDARDPQRLWYAWPTDVVPWGRDTRTGSSTLGYPLYELWGQPVNPFTYQCYGLRKGTDLVNPGDTLPSAVGEDCVLARTRWYAYEWAEANKDMAPRASGPDFRFLMEKADKDYIRLRTMYRRQDRELVDNWFSIRGLTVPIFSLGHYNTMSGTAGPA